MAYKITIVAKLENDDGVMCTQTTVWEGMNNGEMLTLEGSYLDWQASLPRTIGSDTSADTKKR